MQPVGKQGEEGGGWGGRCGGAESRSGSGGGFHSEVEVISVPVKSVSFTLEGKLEHLPAGSHLDGQFLSLSLFVLTATFGGRYLCSSEGEGSPK